jgi:hypothetical protein
MGQSSLVMNFRRASPFVPDLHFLIVFSIFLHSRVQILIGQRNAVHQDPAVVVLVLPGALGSQILHHECRNAIVVELELAVVQLGVVVHLPTRTALCRDADL